MGSRVRVPSAPQKKILSNRLGFFCFYRILDSLEHLETYTPILSATAPIIPTSSKIFLHLCKKVTHFFCLLKKIAYLCTRISARSACSSEKVCGNSSVGRAQPCQGWGREFESRFPLKNFPKPRWRNGRRARFRCECFTTCRFESCSGHELQGKELQNITGEVAELVDALL